MSLTLSQVRDIFTTLVVGNGGKFFSHVADNVDWTVEGTHPLAGHYQSKADFLSHTLVSGDWAVVELRSLASAQNGLRFENRYCWVCRFSADKIVEVRAYLDSALVVRLFEENPILCASGSSTAVNDPVIFTALNIQNTCFTSRMFDATVSSNSVVFPSNINLPIASA